MQDFVNKREKVLDIMRRIASFAKSKQREDLYSDISYEAHYLAEGKLTLMVAGEFKRGKSSLINMLLGEENLCPVAVHITTCAVTVITYGPKERITVYFRREDNPAEIGISESDKGVEITRKQLKDYCSEQYNKKNVKKVSLIKVELPNKLLEKGLVIVDTPGVGGVYQEHSLITLGFMSSADAVLFVSDAQNPVADTEIKFLQNASEYCRNFIFAMTHKDLVLDYEKVQEGNQSKIAQGLGLAPEQVKVIPVSSKSKQRYITTGLEEYLENSNYTELETEIWDMLTKRGGSILLLRALMVADTTLSEIKQPIADEIAIFQAKDKQELQAIENELKEVRKQFEMQNSKQAEWRNELARGIRNINLEINTLLQQGFVAIHPNVKSYIEQNIERNGELVPKEILQLVEQDIQVNNARISREFMVMVTDLTKRIEQKAGVSMNTFDIGEAKLELSGVGLDKNFNKRDTWEIVRNGVLGSSVGATIAGFVCGGLGGLGGLLTGGVHAIPLAIVSAKAGAAAWMAVGGLFGAGCGVKKSLDNSKTKSVSELRAALEPILKDAEIESGKWLRKALLQLEADMPDDFADKITQRLKQIKEMERKLHAAYTTSVTDANARMAILKPMYDELSGYQKEIADQINSIQQVMGNTAS